MTNSIAVIGGGASGLTAAIAAARSGKYSVTVYESGGRVGRKILATGNGRCNMTNINADTRFYHGQNPGFILGAKRGFWVKETIDFFEELGVVVNVEEDGKVYPYSNQASAVLDVLRFKIDDTDNIRIMLPFEVKTVTKTGERFVITAFDGRQETADKVIIATGGKAAPAFGSKGVGYDILKAFGHKITPLAPSLVQIKTETDVVKKLKGIKLDADVTLGGEREYGEVLFTEYGLSGPAVFSLSSRLGNTKTVSLDIMSRYDKDELYVKILDRIAKRPKITLDNFFVGMFHKRVGQAILKCAGIEPLSRYAVTLSEKEIARVCAIIKKWDFRITGTMSWNNAQVTKGGAVTDEFEPETMESKKVKNLYAAGEVLDIDGDCGGYNLQWAWSSGYLAGTEAGK